MHRYIAILSQDLSFSGGYGLKSLVPRRRGGSSTANSLSPEQTRRCTVLLSGSPGVPGEIYRPVLPLRRRNLTRASLARTPRAILSAPLRAPCMKRLRGKVCRP